MNCPPTKRQRRLNDDAPAAMTSDDPFGDDEGFTQDELDEIDIIASQAFPQGEGPSVTRPMAGHSSENTPVFSRQPLANRPQQFVSDVTDAYSILEGQHAELKRKLMEVEEEIMLKNGEIRLLRDSLKGAQQEKEAQRQTQLLLDIQKHNEQSHKEKELNKKVQALQTELHFKEAEINQMKSKLHSSDRKKTAALLPRHSPKGQSSLSRLNGDSAGSSSPLANGFITKEMFETPRPSKAAPEKTRESGDRGFSRNPERDPPDPFMSRRPAPLQLQGRVLLGLLLQQPLSPSSLGLSHLLSRSLTSRAVSTGWPPHSEGAVSGPPSRASLSQVQSLARNGLNMLSQSHAHVSPGTTNQRSCPGAVLFLPLVDFHLSECLGSLCSSSSAAAGSDSAAVPSVAPTDEPSRLDTGFTGFSVEEAALAALRLLYLLVSHSDEVVEAVLSTESLSSDAEKKGCGDGLCSQNALLQSLLRLCEGGVGGSVGPLMEELRLGALKTLAVVIQRAPPSHSHSWKRVLQMMAAGLSTDSPVRTVSAYVHVLMSLWDQSSLGQQLCAQSDHCVFSKLFQLIRTRPDELAAQPDWVQLDLQVVRLLSRMMSQRSEVRQKQCQCSSEMVQTVVLVFHRQWLDLWDPPQPTNPPGVAAPAPWWLRPAAALLREALLLLHWLLLHHRSFSESCRPLLHMYDQVVPAVQDVLRRVPGRSESEEVALEEICRSEGDDPDDAHSDPVS